MTYEYSCSTCSCSFEQEQKITDDSLPPCPKCGQGTGVRRLISQGNFLLKGGGWYSDGYQRS